MNAFEEIVGARIGTIITNDPEVIIAAVKTGTVSQWLTRVQMRFMAACDLGPHWHNMANGKTLFCMGEDGVPYAAERKR